MNLRKPRRAVQMFLRMPWNTENKILNLCKKSWTDSFVQILIRKIVPIQLRQKKLEEIKDWKRLDARILFLASLKQLKMH